MFKIGLFRFYMQRNQFIKILLLRIVIVRSRFSEWLRHPYIDRTLPLRTLETLSLPWPLSSRKWVKSVRKNYTTRIKKKCRPKETIVIALLIRPSSMWVTLIRVGRFSSIIASQGKTTQGKTTAFLIFFFQEPWTNCRWTCNTFWSLNCRPLHADLPPFLLFILLIFQFNRRRWRWSQTRPTSFEQ